MDEAKRARTAETPKQPCFGLKLRAPYFYPDPPTLMRGTSSTGAIFSSLSRQPDRPNTVSACPSRSLTVLSRPLRDAPWMTPNLRLLSETGSMGCGSSPAITASASAHAWTVRAIGPIESREYESGKAPSVGTRYLLGLKPTMPHNAAGTRTDPPVSEPIAISHMPSATATAPPDDDPPGTLARSTGLPGVPYCGFSPMMVAAKFTHIVLCRDNGARGTQAPDHRRVEHRGHSLFG
jgi:hypothetical protein